MNNGLLIYQENKRKESIEKVRWSVETIKDLEGNHAIIKPEKIMEMTGLSKTAIYKPHLREIWDEKYQNNDSQKFSTLKLELQIQKLEKELSQLNSNLNKAELQITKLKQNLELEQSRSKVFINEYEQQKKENEKLLYHNLIILRALHIRGITIDELKEENDYKELSTI